MSALSNDAREQQRLELLAEAGYERFGPAPWRELHMRPSPAPAIPRPLVRFIETRTAIARHRRILFDALGDPGTTQAERAA